MGSQFPQGTPHQNQHDYNYNYYQQGGIYNNAYYNNYNTAHLGYTMNPNVPNSAYASYQNYNTNYTLPVSHTTVPEVNVQPQSIALDLSKTSHFWDDCEYIKYVGGADSCSMCDEEVEDDLELQEHFRAQHHVIFFACTKCRIVHGDLNIFRTHDCTPYTPPELTPQPVHDKKRKRAKQDDKQSAPVPKVSEKVQEKVVLNNYGAVYVHPQKRTRPKPTPGHAQIQDILQWQQSYNTQSNSLNQQQQEGTGSELVLKEDSDNSIIPLTRELLMEAKNSLDGIPVEIDRMPSSAVVCRTCNLLFASSHQLNKHAGFSRTHKTNVDVQRRQEQKAIRFDVTGDTSKKQQQQLADNETYRDRSAERRAENPEGCPLDYQPIDAVTDYISTDTPIEANNVGRKLLESMGWKEGKGLGKNEVGIVNPIVPQKMARGAGLGTEINSHEIAASEASSYSDYLRNKKLARYAQLAKTIRDPVGPP